MDKLLLECDVVIEGIFGTGLNSEIKGIYKDIILKINEYSKNKKVYAIDIPSGINGDTGEIMGVSVKADVTISFVTYKKGFLKSDIKEYLGTVIIENIGLNKNNIDHIVSEYYLTSEIIKGFHIKRDENSHKGDFGKVLIFAGSSGFYGAGNIVAKSCVRSGAGLTTVITDKNNFSLNVFVPEAMSFPVNFENIEENFEKVHTMYNKTYDEDYLYLCKPYEGITELIEELKKQQCIVAVLSNKPHSTTVKIIEALFGKGTFTKIYGQREGIPLKPDAQALCSILDELELSKEECVYIGDTKTDMLTGKNANVFTVGGLWGFRDRDELEQYQADVIISSPEELLTIE